MQSTDYTLILCMQVAELNQRLEQRRREALPRKVEIQTTRRPTQVRIHSHAQGLPRHIQESACVAALHGPC